MGKYLYCIIGLPCSGKTTAAKLMADKVFSNPNCIISTGDIARELSTSTELQLQTAAADLFPLEDLIRNTIQSRVENYFKSTDSVILEGCPRFDDQANWLIDTFWSYDPTVIEINAGDIRTLQLRARARNRNTQDSSELFVQRLTLAVQNMSKVYSVLNKRLVATHTIMSGSNESMINSFKKVIHK